MPREPKDRSVVPDDYSALLGEIRGLLQTARARAYQAVDNIKVQAYWSVSASSGPSWSTRSAPTMAPASSSNSRVTSR